MSAPAPGEAGTTRICPHCKTTILQSSAVCPACRGHLRFDAATNDAGQRFIPLQVEGTLRGDEQGSFEYTMVVVIRNERGEEVGRHVAGVGAVLPGQSRTFSVTVEAVPVTAKTRRRH